MRALIAAVCLVLATPVALASPVPRYKVIADDAGEIHRSVEVRLERRISEADLKAIARTIQEREARAYRRTLVNFYLPGMKQGQGAWASATHTKDISVRISGLTLEEEASFIAEARVDGRSLVGSWLTSTPAAPGRLTIYRDRGKLFAEWKLRNGVKTVDEVAEKKTSTGRRFDNVPQTADHFVLIGNGELELRQGDHLVALAEQIDTSPAGKSAPVAQATPQKAAEPEARAASFVPVKGRSGQRAVAAPVDPNEPLKITPRGMAEAVVEQTKAESRDASPPNSAMSAAANTAPAADEVAEDQPKKRQQSANTPRPPRQRQQHAGGTSKPAGSGAQERLIGQLFRAPY